MARWSWRRRDGSAITSISAILSSLIVRPMARRSFPRGATTTPTAPSTSAGRANRAGRENTRVSFATAWAPRSSAGPAGSAARSARRTTSGSRTARSALMSPPRAAARKGAGDLPLPGEVGAGTRGCALDPAAGPAGELLGGGRGALHDGSDLIEGHGEQVVQHERDPFGGCQPVEDYQQRETDRVRQERFLLGVALLLAVHDREEGDPEQEALLADSVGLALLV